MLELLNKRKEIRELLNQYPASQWDNIIPLILEIGIIYLKSTYSTVNFPAEDFQKILHEMKEKHKNNGII